jgi:signal transduction histidine kinase
MKSSILDTLKGKKFREGDIETTRRVVMINAISVVGVIFLLLLGAVSFYQKSTIVGIADVTVAVILASNIIYMYKSGNYKFASYFGIVMAGLLFIYLFLKGESNNTTHLWYYTFPLFAAFLLGSRHGAVATMLILIPPVVLFLLPTVPPFFAEYTLDFKIRFIPSFLVVLMFSYTFERVREITHSKYQFKHMELENQTKELEQLNKKLRREIVQRKRGERKLFEAKEEAEHANRAKSNFLTNMSHELRTPLNHIIGFVELLLDRSAGDLNAQQDEYLRDVSESSRHLLALINDILDLSKVEAGKLNLHMKEIRLQHFFENSFNIVREKALKHAIALKTDIGKLPDVLLADEKMLKQILYNLLSNAVKFTPDGGTVTLLVRSNFNGSHDDSHETANAVFDAETMHRGEKHIQVSVIDTGIGITEKDLTRVFQPFEQAEPSISKQYSGTGLGLSLTKELVEHHGGRIWAESQGPGKGSAFHFTIPLVIRG